MSDKPQSWKAVRDQRRKENFVGRADQLRVFSENFAAETPIYMVFAVTGEGGVGKSTLLTQYNTMACSSSINAKVVVCDDRHSSPAAAMGHIASELAKQEITHHQFDERYKKYCELRQEVEGDPKAPRSAVNVLTHGLSDFAIKALRRTPGVGMFFEYADEKAAGDALAESVNYFIDRWGNKDEVQLLREPEQILTPLFLQLLVKVCDNQRIVLMFDVFERTHDALSPWLLALGNFEYGDFNTNLSFVISGRDPLEQHWTELAGAICRITLEPFTLEETQIYLSNQGISDKKLSMQIHTDTGGLPVLVELLAATNPQPGAALPDISKDAVARFLQWTPQEEHRRVALFAAVPRHFNRDVLSAILGGDAANMFNWLAAQSYIRTNTERGWFYHEKVRELMLRYLRNTIPSELFASHGRLAEHFAAAQKQLNLEGKAGYDSETWRKLENDRAYHDLSNRGERGIPEVVNAFLHAFRWRWGFAESIVQICQQAATETGLKMMHDCASMLSDAYRAYDQENYPIIIEILSSLETQDKLTPMARCALYARRGATYQRMGEQEQALADLDRAIALDEKFVWAIEMRGESYRRLRKYEQALCDFDRAIALDEKDAWAIANRGETYRQMDKYEQALPDFDRAIALDEKYAWAIANRGETYRQMKKYEQALSDFDRAIALDEKYAWAIAHRGETYRQMGKYEQALADLDRGILLNEEFYWAIANRGETYRQTGRFEQALADFDRAIALNEKYVWAIANRGETYRQMGKYDQALLDFGSAIALDEKYAWAIAHRGETHRQMKKYEQALPDFDRAIVLDDKFSWGIGVRGETYRQTGKYEQALTDFNRAIALNEKFAWAIAHRGQTYRQIGEYEQALTDLDRAIALNEKYEWAIAQRGTTYRQMGKFEQALVDLDRGIELNAKESWMWGTRGETYRRLGKYENAIRDFTSALDLNSVSSFYLHRRAACYLELDDTQAFQADLDRALILPLEDASDFYNRCVTLVLVNRHVEAIDILKQAFERDIAQSIFAQTDDLLDPIRQLPEFREVMDSMEPLCKALSSTIVAANE